MTPEALAEVNGHIDVIRVLRVWERLQLRDSQSQHSSQGGSPAGPHSERGDSMSPHTSTSQLSQDDASEHYESVRSRTGRDRAMSFASTVSDTPSQRSQSLRLKRSLDGLLQGKRPDHAGSDSIHDAASPIVHDAKSQPRLPHDDAEADLLNPSSPMEVEPETAMPLHASLNADTSLERVFTATSAGSTDLASTPSSESIVSAPPGSVVAPQIASVILAPPPPRRNTYSSSHRPTLPSIFEKAVHPGVALRAAMRRDLEIKPRSSSDFTSSFEETSPRSASFSGSLFRGRNKTVEVSSRQAAARKYMSKQGLVQLFRRGQSPPSRSPSPPDRNDKVIAPEELDEGIERLKRASFELDFREGQEDSTEAIDPTEEEVRRPPASAPAIKTRFFEDLDAPALPPLNMAFYTARRDDRRPMSANTSGNERPRNRPRTGSEVISPSPLAKEWATDEDSDSYSSPRRGMRRAMSSVSHGNPLLRISPPVSPVLADVTELRFSTLRIASSPLDTCSTMSPNLTVDTEPRPEKLVSGVLEQENELHHPALEDSNGGEGEEEEFHDALDFGEPEILAPKVDPEAHALEPVSTEISLAETATQDAEGRAENIQPQTAAGVEQPVDEEEVRARESKSVELQGVQQISTNVPQRYRGASIGSVNTESSRISEPSESSPMTSLITDEDGSERGSLGYNPTKPLSDPKKKPSQRPPSVRSMVDGRPRNISVSSTSTSTSASGVAFSYMQTASTPGTSLTPASTLSVHLPGGFPPVPEHEVAPHPVARRKVSSRAEAADIVKQYEDDILQLAQMPLSQDSSRSLAAQLAAYGDNHAIEQEFAEREARATQSSDMDSSDNASFFSAGESAQSGISSPRSSERASQPSIGRKCEYMFFTRGSLRRSNRLSQLEPHRVYSRSMLHRVPPCRQSIVFTTSVQLPIAIGWWRSPPNRLCPRRRPVLPECDRGPPALDMFQKHGSTPGPANVGQAKIISSQSRKVIPIYLGRCLWSPPLSSHHASSNYPQSEQPHRACKPLTVNTLLLPHTPSQGPTHPMSPHVWAISLNRILQAPPRHLSPMSFPLASRGSHLRSQANPLHHHIFRSSAVGIRVIRATVASRTMTNRVQVSIL